MDHVILVNQQDRRLGTMDKVAAHRGAGKLHRAISVFLFNQKGELLIQQRAATKIVGALQWANTCCGNLRPTETYLQCAHRRLKEELGIEGVKLNKLIKFVYHVPCNSLYSEHEMDTVYLGRFDGAVHPNPQEACAYRWISFDQLLQPDIVPWVIEMHKQGIIQTIKEKVYAS